MPVAAAGGDGRPLGTVATSEGRDRRAVVRALADLVVADLLRYPPGGQEVGE